MKGTNELRSALAGFTGSKTFTRHGMVPTFVLTEGATFFADNAGGGAWWLMDILATEPAIRALIEREGFANIKLSVGDNAMLITVDDGNDTGEPPDFRREIHLTDCPDGEWQFFLVQSFFPANPSACSCCPASIESVNCKQERKRI